ncbi:MAG: hypothetical protein ACYS3S_16430 [Planctomycetota bacterium]
MIQGQSGGAFHGSTHLSEFCPGRCLIAIGMQYELDIDEGQAQILLRISISACTGVLGDDLLFSRAWRNDYLARLVLCDLCLQVTMITVTANTVRAIPTLHINHEGIVESVLSFFAADHRSDGVSDKMMVLKPVLMSCSIIMNP